MKFVALAMVLLVGLLALTVPAQATSYEITFTLKESGKVFWTTTRTFETASSNVTVLVPAGFYDMIKLWFTTDTFNTSFTLNLSINNATLEVVSNPSGVTVVFQPLSPGDVNGDKIVDIYDLVSVIEPFGGYSLFHDLYFDFTFEVDIYDLVIIAINFGREY